MHKREFQKKPRQKAQTSLISLPYIETETKTLVTRIPNVFGGENGPFNPRTEARG